MSILPPFCWGSYLYYSHIENNYHLVKEIETKFHLPDAFALRNMTFKAKGNSLIKTYTRTGTLNCDVSLKSLVCSAGIYFSPYLLHILDTLFPASTGVLRSRNMAIEPFQTRFVLICTKL